MKLNNELIQELGTILQSDFNLQLPGDQLEKLAYSLVGYFDLLLRLENRKVRNCPASLIDNSSSKEDDKENEYEN